MVICSKNTTNSCYPVRTKRRNKVVITGYISIVLILNFMVRQFIFRIKIITLYLIPSVIFYRFIFFKQTSTAKISYQLVRSVQF